MFVRGFFKVKNSHTGSKQSMIQEMLRKTNELVKVMLNNYQCTIVMRHRLFARLLHEFLLWRQQEIDILEIESLRRIFESKMLSFYNNSNDKNDPQSFETEFCLSLTEYWFETITMQSMCHIFWHYFSMGNQ